MLPLIDDFTFHLFLSLDYPPQERDSSVSHYWIPLFQKQHVSRCLHFETPAGAEILSLRTSLVVQRLRLRASTEGGTGSVPDWGTKIPCALTVDRQMIRLLLLLTKSCPTLQPVDCSLPDSPVLHHLPEFAQIHVHSTGDAVKPSHPLSPSSFAFNLSR